MRLVWRARSGAFAAVFRVSAAERLIADHGGFLPRQALCARKWLKEVGSLAPRDMPRIECYRRVMTKTELHRLVDQLPEESLPAAAVLLRRAQDPLVAKLDAAPYDAKR
jgi:hypothetical protein